MLPNPRLMWGCQPPCRSTSISCVVTRAAPMGAHSKLCEKNGPMGGWKGQTGPLFLPKQPKNQTCRPLPTPLGPTLVARANLGSSACETCHEFCAVSVHVRGGLANNPPRIRGGFRGEFVTKPAPNSGRVFGQVQGGFLGKFMANVLRCQSKQPIGPWAPVAPAVAP